MEKEEPDTVKVESKESDRVKMTGEECLDFIAYSEKCNVGAYYTAEERRDASQHSIAYNPSFTLIDQKANFGALLKELKSKKTEPERKGSSGKWDVLGNNQEMERIGNTGEAETANKYNNSKNSFETDEHAKLKLAKAKRRSQKKQRDTNSASNIKNKQHKKDMRAAHNILRDSPGEIDCLLLDKICNRKNHKDRLKHFICPFMQLFRINKGKCIRIIYIE